MVELKKIEICLWQVPQKKKTRPFPLSLKLSIISTIVQSQPINFLKTSFKNIRFNIWATILIQQFCDKVVYIFFFFLRLTGKEDGVEVPF